MFSLRQNSASFLICSFRKSTIVRTTISSRVITPSQAELRRLRPPFKRPSSIQHRLPRHRFALSGWSAAEYVFSAEGATFTFEPGATPQENGQSRVNER